MDEWIGGSLFPVVFFFAAVLTCFAYGARTMPLESDSQHYFYISERVAAGVPPHVSQLEV